MPFLTIFQALYHEQNTKVESSQSSEAQMKDFPSEWEDSATTDTLDLLKRDVTHSAGNDKHHSSFCTKNCG